jgi:hypothetical protein
MTTKSRGIAKEKAPREKASPSPRRQKARRGGRERQSHVARSAKRRKTWEEKSAAERYEANRRYLKEVTYIEKATHLLHENIIEDGAKIESDWLDEKEVPFFASSLAEETSRRAKRARRDFLGGHSLAFYT